MFFKNFITGIDIGTKLIKLISAQMHNEKIKIKHVSLLQINEDFDEENHIYLAFDLIMKYKAKNNISLKNVAIICPKHFYEVLNITLPEIKKEKDLRSAINWEFKNKTGLDIEDFNIDYYPNGKADENNIEYLVYYAEKNKMEEIQRKGRLFGLNINYIDVDTIANVICFNTLYNLDDNVRVLLDMGYQHTNITFVSKEKILFNRDLSLGILNLVSVLENEEVKILKVKGINSEEITQKLNNILTDFIIEITRTIDYFISGLKQPAPVGIICNGGFFSIPGLFSFFKEHFPYPLILNNVFEHIDYNGEYKNVGHLFNLALGVALR